MRVWRPSATDRRALAAAGRVMSSPCLGRDFGPPLMSGRHRGVFRRLPRRRWAGAPARCGGCMDTPSAREGRRGVSEPHVPQPIEPGGAMKPPPVLVVLSCRDAGSALPGKAGVRKKPRSRRLRYPSRVPKPKFVSCPGGVVRISDAIRTLANSCFLCGFRI